MKYTYKLQIGDWSGDGHGISRNVIFQTNTLKSLIVGAHREFAVNYKVACHRFDQNPIKGLIVFCDTYGEFQYNPKGLKILKSIGCFDCRDVNDFSSSEYPIEQMYFTMVKFINKDFEYKIIPDSYEVINREFIGYGTLGN